MKLAADANVLLSALIGGQAMRVLRHQTIEEILTTEVTLAEVAHDRFAARRFAIKVSTCLPAILETASSMPSAVIAATFALVSAKRLWRMTPSQPKIPAEIEVRACQP